jgi:hypothetical protein
MKLGIHSGRVVTAAQATCPNTAFGGLNEVRLADRELPTSGSRISAPPLHYEAPQGSEIGYAEPTEAVALRGPSSQRRFGDIAWLAAEEPDPGLASSPLSA